MTPVTPAPLTVKRLKFNLFAASLLSGIGDQIYLLAIPLFLLDQFGSTGLASGVRAAEVAASAVASIYLGYALDRSGSRRLTMQLTWVLIGLGVLLSLVTLLPLNAALLAVMIALTLAIMGLSRVYSIAFQTAMPALPQRDALIGFNARMGTIMTFVAVSGVGLAGALYAALPVSALLLINALSFALFLLPASALPADVGRKVNAKPAPLLPAYMEAARYIRASRELTYVTAGFLAYSAVTASTALYTMFILKQDFAYSAHAIGVALLCANLGGLLGSASASRLLGWLGPLAGFRLAVLLGSGLVAIQGLTVHPVAMVIVLAGVLFCTYVANVAHVSLRQLASTPDNRGRILGLSNMLLRLAAPVGLLLFGALDGAAGHTAAFLSSGAAGVCLIILLELQGRVDAAPNADVTVQPDSAAVTRQSNGGG